MIEFRDNSQVRSPFISSIYANIPCPSNGVGFRRSNEGHTFWMDSQFPRVMPTLPPEIVEYSATFLWSDIKALQSWRLSCRTWNDLIRPYIFRSITLNSEKRLSEFESLLDNVPSMRFWVRELIVMAKLHSARDYCSIPWIDRLPLELPSKLEKLHTLGIFDFQDFWDPSEHNGFFDHFSSFSSVKSLSFVNCVFPASILLAFVCSLPGLLDVHFHDIQVMSSMFVSGSPASKTKKPSLHPPCLTSLRIHSGNSTSTQPLREFLGWFIGNETMQSLRTVQIHIQSIASIEDTGSFLKTLGPRLRELELYFVGAQHWGVTRGLPGMLLRAYTHTQLKSYSIGTQISPGTSIYRIIPAWKACTCMI